MFRLHVWLVVYEHSWYSTAWQVALTTGFRVSTCSRTNTDSVLYLFVTCTRPPDIYTGRVRETRIVCLAQLQPNQDTILRPHLRMMRRHPPEKTTRQVLAQQPPNILVDHDSATCWLTGNRCIPCIPIVIDWSYIVKWSSDSLKCTAGSCTGTTGHCQQHRTRKGHGPTFGLNIMTRWTGFCSNKSAQRF